MYDYLHHSDAVILMYRTSDIMKGTFVRIIDGSSIYYSMPLSNYCFLQVWCWTELELNIVTMVYDVMSVWLCACSVWCI